MKPLTVFLLFVLLMFIPATMQAQGDTNIVTITFPVSNNTVSSAGDYYVNIISFTPPNANVARDARQGQADLSGNYTMNYLELYPETTSSTLLPFLRVGLLTTDDGVYWFASGPREHVDAPTITCYRNSFEFWSNSQGRHTGCIGRADDLGIGFETWHRVQLVTYNDKDWVAKITNVDGYIHDVARFKAINGKRLNLASVVMETRRTDPDSNPWVKAKYYNFDFKYRNGGWMQWPSNIGGNYGSNKIIASNTICPSFYGVAHNFSGQPYLWAMGDSLLLDGEECHGSIYAGGGPSTEMWSVIAESSQKAVSSENGNSCIRANRNVPGLWEQWHADNLGGNRFAYQGNNGKYLIRNGDDRIWSHASGSGSNNARFERTEITPFVFRLKNIGNNKYLQHHFGNECVKADSSFVDVDGPTEDQKFRYVAY